MRCALTARAACACSGCSRHRRTLCAAAAGKLVAAAPVSHRVCAHLAALCRWRWAFGVLDVCGGLRFFFLVRRRTRRFVDPCVCCHGAPGISVAACSRRALPSRMWCRCLRSFSASFFPVVAHPPRCCLTHAYPCACRRCVGVLGLLAALVSAEAAPSRTVVAHVRVCRRFCPGGILGGAAGPSGEWR